MKKIRNHFERWNKWRKRNTNSRWYKFLVLIGLVQSPTFKYTLTDSEVKEFVDKFINSLKLNIEDYIEKL